MRVDVADFNRLAADLREAGPKGRLAAARATEKSIRDIERDAKAFAPVDTGNLRGSITSETEITGSSIRGEVGPTASYGAYVEFGTSRMAPHAYLGPAFDRHAGKWHDALEQIMGGVLG